MANFLTNRGAKLMLDSFFRDQNSPAGFRVALLVPQTVNKSDATTSDVTQIASGNGYTTVSGAAGEVLARSGSGWDTITQDDTLNYVYVQAVDVTFTSSGGGIPSSGEPIRYMAICDEASPNNLIAIVDLSTNQELPVAGWDLTVSNITVFIPNL